MTRAYMELFQQIMTYESMYEVLHGYVEYSSCRVLEYQATVESRKDTEYETIAAAPQEYE